MLCKGIPDCAILKVKPSRTVFLFGEMRIIGGEKFIA